MAEHRQVVVCGLFDSDDDASIALNNLDEAGYRAASISVVTNATARTEALTRVRGPLSGLQPDALSRRLADIGMAAADCAAFRDGIAAGAAFIGINTVPASADSAAQSLRDQHGRQVCTLTGGAIERGPQ
ncbi:MAG: hypothetical protein ACYDCQ_23150 [Dehalococcoidia bacterium]